MKSVPIPSDIDQEDRILGSLTARQLVIIAIPAIALWGFYLATRRFIPLAVFVPFAVVVSGITGGLVIGRRDGLTMDRFVIAALRHMRSAHKFVPVSDDIVAPPAFVNAMAQGTPSPLDLPIRDVDADGVVDLGVDGTAIIATASSINFSLQSELDQEALSEAFGRFCNSLQEPVQFLVRAERVDLTAAIRSLELHAPELPSIALERCARDYAAFLAEVSGRHDVLGRSVFVVFHDPRPIDVAAARLVRRAQEAVTSLRSAGVTLTVLDCAQATHVIQSACDPDGHGKPLSEQLIVTGGSR